MDYTQIDGVWPTLISYLFPLHSSLSDVFLLDSHCILLRSLFRNQNVKFVAEPAMQPKDLEMDPKLAEQYANELQLAQNAPLPDDDDL